jgi:fibro-slime domain-containing protein
MRPTLLATLVLAACGPHVGGPDGGGNGNGDGGLLGDGGGFSADAATCGELTARIRDFRVDHPDMEGALGDDRGLVQAQLGGDGKPVYAPGGATGTVSGAASFDQWYRDVAGTNQPFDIPIVLTQTGPGTFVFEDLDFFPIDGLGWGNEGNARNFHFTTEIHGTFRYGGGETFTFTGDDDVFVFVNRRLAIDLGGVHGVEAATIDFDARAGELGIMPGTTYALDVFHAERHTTASNFRIETSIACLVIE